MHHFGPWLLALFLIAEVVGVVPLFSAHTHHVFESKQVVSGNEGITAVGPRGTHHHHGIADLNDQCCAYHHLAGVLPFIVGARPVKFAKAVIVMRQTRALLPSDPILLERPPKPFLSI
jgi:hypothetical protein